MTKPAENTIEARATPYIERVENVLDELDTMKGEYMAACKAKREDIKEIYTEAKDDDLSPKVLKKIVKRRELERKQIELDESMKGEEGEYDYEMLVAALGDLGDLPLGQAALGLAGAVEHAEALQGKESPEEREALAEVEAAGIGAAAGATAH